MKDDGVQPPARAVYISIHSECNPVSVVPGNVYSSTSTCGLGQVIWMAEP